MWKIGEYVGDNEGRMDVCVAAAGVLKSHTDCLEYPADQFRDVRTYLSHLIPCSISVFLSHPSHYILILY